jgi:hypothetical protein
VSWDLLIRCGLIIAVNHQQRTRSGLALLSSFSPGGASGKRESTARPRSPGDKRPSPAFFNSTRKQNNRAARGSASSY